MSKHHDDRGMSGEWFRLAMEVARVLHLPATILGLVPRRDGRRRSGHRHRRAGR